METTDIPAQMTERDYAGEAAAWLRAFTAPGGERVSPDRMTAEQLLAFALVQATIGQARAIEAQTEAIEAQTIALEKLEATIPADYRPPGRFRGNR